MKKIIRVIIVILLLLLIPATVTFKRGIDWPFLNCYFLVLTLIAICWYSNETYLIRKTTVEQKELQIQPLLIIDFMEQEGRKGLYLKNIGNGVAMNISIEDRTLKVKNYEFILTSKNMNSLGKGAFMLLKTSINIDNKKILDDSFPWEANLDPQFANSNYEFKITYENIQHIKYSTIVSTGKEGINIKHWGKA